MRVADGQRSCRCQCLQHQQVGIGKQAAVIKLVDQFNGADFLCMHGHGCAQDRACLETGGVIYGVIKIRILAYILDDAAAVFSHALANDTLTVFYGNSTDVHRAGTGLANK